MIEKVARRFWGRARPMVPAAVRRSALPKLRGPYYRLFPERRPNAPRDGVDLRPGDAHYRAYVGPPADYDLIAGLQFSLLFAAGLREQHRLLDLGCGSLRSGRLLIPYLALGRYYGIEPDKRLVKEGIRNEVGRDLIAIKAPHFAYVDDFRPSASAFASTTSWPRASSATRIGISS